MKTRELGQIPTHSARNCRHPRILIRAKINLLKVQGVHSCWKTWKNWKTWKMGLFLKTGWKTWKYMPFTISVLEKLENLFF